MNSTPLAAPLLLSVVLLVAVPPGQAQTAPTPEPTPAVAAQTGEDAELLGLLKILKEETAVATKTRMNSDYVPGIVTVLQGREMAALGARTVWDALSMVPGIEVVRDATGVPSVTVRGIQFPFNSGNVKILVDSMPAVRDNAGINGIVLDLPIQIVDRIEVIRGPGSVVYGDFAYMGLVQIITRKTGLGVYGRVDEGTAYSGGLFGGGVTRGGLAYSLSASAFTGSGADMPSRRDVDDQRGFAFGALKYQGLSLSGGLVTGQVKDASTVTPDNGQQTHTVVEARYEKDLSKNAHLDLRLNDRGNRYRNVQADLDGRVIEAGMGLRVSSGGRHSWLFDTSYTRSNIDAARFKIPVQAIAAPPPAPPAGTPGSPAPGTSPAPLGFSISNENLAFKSVMAQDTIDASSKIAITVGARFDQYADVDSRITPRASLVFRATDKTILKFQYAEGFRAPTFFELYSRGLRYTDLNFEVNQTVEMNLVRRTPGTVFRLTAYSANFKSLLFVTGVDAQRRTLFGNSARARVLGSELEIEREVSAKLKAVFNLAVFDTRDSRAADGLEIKRDNVPPFMGNLALIAAPAPRVQLTARWHYVGDRPAADLPAYHEIEATATLQGVLGRGVDLRAGVRRSTGAGVVYPHVLPTTTTALSYEFPKVFVELSWTR